MLKVIDGLRTFNAAAPDLAAQSVTTQVNTGSVDMANFAELLVVGQCNSLGGGGVGSLAIQESNEAAANFTNITNAALAFTVANTMKVWSGDWRKPNRKRYARLAAFNTTANVTMSAVTLRVRPTRAALTLEANGSQTDS